MSLTSQEANARGLAALRDGDLALAQQWFAEAVALDPAAGSLWRNLAHARRLAGDAAGERAALEGALGVDARDLPALVRLAQWFERAGDRREAMLRWSGVIQLGEQVTNPSEELSHLLAHARDYCAVQGAALATPIRQALEPRYDAFGQASRRRAQAFIEHSLGNRRIYPNVCAGLHYPFLPADEFFDDHHFTWFDQLAAETAAIRGELEALIADPGEELIPYVRMEKGVSGSQWDPLNHNLDWGACFLWEYGRPNTPVLERCPRTAAALARLPGARIPGRAPSAFFSMLKPHTRIPPHTGVTNTRAIVHLPLIVPPGCGFRVGGERREWILGKPFAFDDTIEHEAWNDSDQLRAVLIFDVWNPHLSSEEQSIVAEYCGMVDDLSGSPQQG
ncbi:aspartyl/asparaginyl beta-hydroxylase domain-containing protein [Sphingomonas mucosissima]|uniref:Aspartyl/asparaginyl beta-hydroxylase n=1 Tax=Sphingomonas mucosissima TaxID=370959 RepID=A0A245ZH77_9SPHN|nr:aspartyl/asparaginyl beta-hydroxylase domain-containing protein [Sphingomonas mucosissima]OWK29096.1 aspartyl/asparaginyl beta-hydroxylase [Sphingomonas mucosissima]